MQEYKGYTIIVRPTANGEEYVWQNNKGEYSKSYASLQNCQKAIDTFITKMPNVQIDGIDDAASPFRLILDGVIIYSSWVLGDAWRRIEWMYQVGSAPFTVGRQKIPVRLWLNNLYANGYMSKETSK